MTLLQLGWQLMSSFTGKPLQLAIYLMGGSHFDNLPQSYKKTKQGMLSHVFSWPIKVEMFSSFPFDKTYPRLIPKMTLLQLG